MSFPNPPISRVFSAPPISQNFPDFFPSSPAMSIKNFIKVSENPVWDLITKNPSASVLTFRKLVFCLLIVFSFPYIFYSVKLLYALNSPSHAALINQSKSVVINSTEPSKTLFQTPPIQTGLEHIVLGIAASAGLWNHRKDYVKLWWKPKKMRGYVWVEEVVENGAGDEHLLPPLKISGDTSRFKYTHPDGHRSAIRLSRIVSETLRLGLKNVRWFVIGDDDTVFVSDNLVRVLSKYDHNQFYYIGSTSESHLQNMNFSTSMAYGGAGFAISYPLAKALSRMQDKCIQRYPHLYGSDDRIHACMTELGVPLTREPGFHQFDVYGNLFGLLSSHPITPLVSFHHLDIVEPIFPHVNQVDALRRLRLPISLDSAGLMQQSICYDKTRRWTVSVSWGYSVQLHRGLIPARELERPARTFLNWYPKATYTAHAFNTRPVFKNPCQRPFVYFFSNAVFHRKKNQTASEYLRFGLTDTECRWKIADPSQVDRIEVLKTPDPNLWDKSPRRNCCRVMPTKEDGSMVIEVGVCRETELITH